MTTVRPTIYLKLLAMLAAFSTPAPSPGQTADIVIAVDNSSCMAAEAVEMQGNLNALFRIFTTKGIDAHFVLMSADSSDSEGVCGPLPPGSGNCPVDENLPQYRPGYGNPGQI